MKNRGLIKVLVLCLMLLVLTSISGTDLSLTKVPMVLDHNRMLVEAEFQRPDGTWRKAVLWVDSGNPDFLMSASLARDLGIDFDSTLVRQDVKPLLNVKIGGKNINFLGIKSTVMIQNQWLFNTMHNDGNIPSTVLSRYHIIFDYPGRTLTIADQGSVKPRGTKTPIIIHPVTGIFQMEALISGDRYSFAFDNGSSFSFLPDSRIQRLSELHPEWPFSSGAVGCANIWGYWDGENEWPMIRIPEVTWGGVKFQNVVIAGLPSFFKGNQDVGTWYSKKTAQPVAGFLGPNVFKNCRVEIDYRNQAVYFEKSQGVPAPDMDILGLTLQPLNDKRYIVLGVVKRDGKPVIEGVEPEDMLLQIDDLKVTGQTMGKVIDAMRGKPGDMKKLILEREGVRFPVNAYVIHIL